MVVENKFLNMRNVPPYDCFYISKSLAVKNIDAYVVRVPIFW